MVLNIAWLSEHIQIFLPDLPALYGKSPVAIAELCTTNLEAVLGNEH